jgi:trk system potassium uptake protein TrkA
MKSMLVIGLGRFGHYLALNLAELGNEVMVVDKDEDRVQQLTPYVTASLIGDCQDEDVLRSLGVGNFDVCFVCISNDFQSSLETSCMLKELGAKYVVSKADRENQSKFLLKIGADEVLHTEKSMARRTAIRFSAKNAFDYIELTPEYAIFEIEAPTEWIGRSVADAKVRAKHNINIIGIRTGDHIEPLLSPDYVFKKSEHLVIAGSKKDAIRIMSKK